MPEAGEILGNTYRLERSLGRGGMGEVWQAQHILLNEPRAIKIILTGFQSDPSVRERFIQGEARNALRLERHPNIVRIYELGLHEDIPYIVMEYIESGPAGHSLKEVLTRRGLLTLVEAGIYLEQLGAALDTAHSQGFVHRDIKPSNILLDKFGKVKLTDFGLIKDIETEQELTSAGYMLGTATYRAPEQAIGKAEPRSDQYAVGIILYQMLTGRVPFTGNSGELVIKHATVAPPSPQVYEPTIPDAVSQVVLKTLAKQPEKRFSSVGELARAFHQAMLGLPPEEELSSFTSVTKRLEVTAAMPRTNGTPTAPKENANNLPTPATAFIGRETEIQKVVELLRQERVRLVTLHGPGGTGKTRLSLQVGQALLPEFADGVFLVELSPVNDPEVMVTTIAQTLGIKETPDQPLLARLKEYLKNRQMLLILDNFEQVTSAAPLVGELLGATTLLKLLVSSREVLHLYGEQTYAVPPLTMPNLQALPPFESLSQYEAVKLFTQCAQAVKLDFKLTPENAVTVAEICVRLDGLPLAIELAAARSRMLAPAAILVRLNNLFKTISGGARDLPARQQTLRGAIDWSFDLLSEAERMLFCRLAVFVGGANFEAIEAICNADQDLPIDTLDGLASLIDKSLLRQVDDEGEPRFVMLGTIREYALEKLEDRNEAEAMRQKHFEYYLALAEETEAKLHGRQKRQGLKRLAPELDNLRVALAWLLETTDDPETALLNGGALYDCLSLWFREQN